MFFFSANKKGLAGNNLVLESDGSIIDDDEILELFRAEVFILLTENEQWSSTGNTGNAAVVIEQQLHDTPILIASYESPELHSDTSILDTSTQLIISSAPSTSQSNLLPSTSRAQQSTPATHDRFNSFEIPFKDLPKHILESLDGKKKLSPSELTIVVHIILAALRKISTTIPAKTIRQIISKLTEIYPSTFEFRDTDDNIIDTTNSPLFIKFVNHANYENRPPKKNKLTPDLKIGDRKKMKPLENTCSNWQPKEIPEGETEESLSQIKEWIKESSGPSMSKKIFEETVEKMKKTFCIQRTFFNGKFKYAEVKKEWPQIFRKKILLNHFTELIDKKFSNYFDNFDEKSKRIVKHFEEKKNEKTKVPVQNDAFIDANGILLLSAFFDEDINCLFKIYEVIFISNMFYHLLIFFLYSLARILILWNHQSKNLGWQ